jgi:hypothetical protein
MANYFLLPAQGYEDRVHVHPAPDNALLESTIDVCQYSNEAIPDMALGVLGD